MTDNEIIKDYPPYLDRPKTHYRTAEETEIENLKAEIERLENSLAISKKETKRYITSYKTTRAEAITEFADRLCEDRVSNDPVVIAVKTELKMMKGNALLEMKYTDRGAWYP